MVDLLALCAFSYGYLWRCYSCCLLTSTEVISVLSKYGRNKLLNCPIILTRQVVNLCLFVSGNGWSLVFISFGKIFLQFYTFLETSLVTVSLLPEFISFFSDGEIIGTPGSLATTFLAFGRILKHNFQSSYWFYLWIYVTLLSHLQFWI